MTSSVQQSVEEDYGTWLASSAEVLSCDYGCGLAVPALLEGARELDLGCGSGRDVYLLAQPVGPTGSVVGVDMTPDQRPSPRPIATTMPSVSGIANVSFLQGDLERLQELDLEPASFDLVVWRGCGACSGPAASSTSPIRGW